MSKHLIALSAAALAACSAGMQPSPNEASLNEMSVSRPIEEALTASPSAGTALVESAPIEAVRVEPAPAERDPPARATRIADPSCDILVQRTPRGVRLKAIARTADPASGHYSMVVTKRGRTGSSDITQGGPFKSAGDADVSLSSAELSVEEASNYQAVLTLHVDDRQVCRRKVQS
jgi:hypothetical protein